MINQVDWNGRCWIYNEYWCLGLAADGKWKALHKNWTGNWYLSEAAMIFPTVIDAEQYLFKTNKADGYHDTKLENFVFPLIGD